MSSIKRDVKKKLCLDRKARFFLEIQPTVVGASPKKLGFWTTYKDGPKVTGYLR